MPTRELTITLPEGITAEWCVRCARNLRNLRGSLALSSNAYAKAYEREIALLEAVAAALRKSST